MSPRRTRLSPARLPAWTAHPGFGVAALFAIAVLLIVHGEPQPSSRPSGKSVVVSGTPSPPSNLPPVMAVHQGVLELRERGTVRRLALPDQAVPRSVLTNGKLCVVLALVGDRQHAYAITSRLTVLDLGYADAALPAVAPAAVLIETAVADPGRLPDNLLTPSSSGVAPASTSQSGPPPLGNFDVRRYDSAGRQLGSVQALPAGMRAGADTTVGLVVWQPANRVFDGAIALEPLSARAVLVRTDGTQRPLGPLYPLAATPDDLLVWDVVRRQFGLMPVSDLTIAGSAGPTARPSDSPRPGKPSASRTTPIPSLTAVPGTLWFDRTRGFTVTGPASFSPDGRSFAVYAQVGSRRRLVVASVADVSSSSQVEVLALTAPVASASAPSTEPTSGAASTSASPGSSAAATSSASSATPGTSSTMPVFAPDGFPIPSTSTPLWTAHQVLGVGTDGTVVSYTPGDDRAALLELGVPNLQSLAAAP